jgi:DNA-binding MarR family transcriptional regulator
VKKPEVAVAVERDLRAVRQLLRKPLDAMIAQGGLTGPQQAAMGVLVKSDGLSLKELSRELGLAHSTVSGIVDRLEKRGMVERKTDGADLRVSRIVPTRQVRQFVRETMPELERHPLTEALAEATEAERKAVAEGIGTLRRLLERRAGSSVPLL